jgi:osmotically-inducible protein OsmY
MFHVRTIAAVCLAAVLGACAGGPETKSTGEYIDDAAITTKVKTALFKAAEVSGFQVNVDTYRGRVQLSGFVKSEAERRKAAELARGVEGVREVVNNLELQ